VFENLKLLSMLRQDQHAWKPSPYVRERVRKLWLAAAHRIHFSAFGKVQYFTFNKHLHLRDAISSEEAGPILDIKRQDKTQAAARSMIRVPLFPSFQLPYKHGVIHTRFFEMSKKKK